MANPKTVKTSDNAEASNILTNLETLSLNDRAKLLAMLRTDAAVVSQANAETEAEVASLSAQIDSWRSEIAALNNRIGEALQRVKALTGRTVALSGAPKGPRAVCPDCGQGRHADNDKTRACKLFNKVTELREAV